MMTYVFLVSLIHLASCTDFQEKVFENLQYLCPGQYVPAENETLDQIKTHDYDSCCTEPYSYSSRGIHVPKRTNFSKESYQTCLFPQINSEPADKYQFEKSYLIITEAPDDGCIVSGNIFENKKVYPTCNDSEVIPIKRFILVYSPSTGLIYKSPQCAYCHGQTDLVFWQAKVSCASISPLSHELDSCVYDFIYPNDDADIQHLECFTDSFSACPNNRQHDIHSTINLTLTIGELSRACSLDHLPRFSHHYFAKNVFCYLCHYLSYWKIMKKCQYPESHTGQRNPKSYALSRIIDSRTLEGDSAFNDLVQQDNVICGMDIDREVCHKLLCPLGQVMLNVGGTTNCQMDSDQWVASKFALLLRLEFDAPVEIIDGHTFSFDQFQSPWSEMWTINKIYIPVEKNVSIQLNYYNVTNGVPIDKMTHVYVEISYTKYFVRPDTFVKTFQPTLSKPWYLTVDNNTFSLRQSFSRYQLYGIRRSSAETIVVLHVVPTWQLIPDAEPFERYLYKFVPNGRQTYLPTYLNQMLLCKQIELSSTNFRLFTVDSTVKALYHYKMSMYLFDNEFVRGHSMHGRSTFRVCIQDTLLLTSDINQSILQPQLSFMLMLAFHYII